MKQTMIPMVALFGSVGMLSAATTLIDYDDGDAGNGIHDSALLDGDFGAINISASDGTSPGSLWFVSHGASDLNFEIRDDNATGIVGTTAQNMTVGAQNNSTKRAMSLDTGYTLQDGDQFAGSFMWRDAYRWEDGSDTIDFTLYYTADNTATGDRTDISTYTSAISSANASWQTETLSGLGTITGSAVGKTLFVEFTPSQFGSGSGGDDFARVDNVYLNVSSIPEPSSAALIGLGGLALILRRGK